MTDETSTKTYDTFEKKIKLLEEDLKKFKKIMVAFSGGKDSFFLLKIALETLGKDNVLACNVRSGFSTRNDRKRVDYFSRRLGRDFRTESLSIDLSGDQIIMSNPKDRCYHCKKKIFTSIKEKAGSLGIDVIADGTTHSDLQEYRPGLKAIEELEIISPLRDAGITSQEIVCYLQTELKIEPYFLTSSACLATRFPYNLQLKPGLLHTFDRIEDFLVDQNIFPVKIRYIDDGIRIETPVSQFPAILEKRLDILLFCKELQLKFITLDIEGIKSGVWD